MPSSTVSHDTNSVLGSLDSVSNASRVPKSLWATVTIAHGDITWRIPTVSLWAQAAAKRTVGVQGVLRETEGSSFRELGTVECLTSDISHNFALDTSLQASSLLSHTQKLSHWLGSCRSWREKSSHSICPHHTYDRSELTWECSLLLSVLPRCLQAYIPCYYL